MLSARPNEPGVVGQASARCEFYKHAPESPPETSRRHKALVTVQVAVALTFVAGFAALSIDIGHAYWARGEIQRASDAAALAGTSSYLSDAGMLVALGE
ncbi:MAG: pilus assembly protein TadG-related protein, partial [Planctomycetota bacterium]